MLLYIHRSRSLTGKFFSATEENRSPGLNVPAAKMLGRLSFQRQPVIIYAMRSKFSTMLWLQVRTSRVPPHRDWQIFKLENVLTVRQKNKFTVKQKNELAVKQMNATAVSQFKAIIQLTKTVYGNQLIKLKYLST